MSRILVVFGTRPEAIKLCPVVSELRKSVGVDVRVCVTGQHRELLDQVLRISGITPDIDLDLMRHDQSLDRLTAAVLEELGPVLERECPDCVVVQGDTASAMAASLAAYYHKIPVAHVEAGLRSGDIHEPWPEEVARRVISAIASYHFAPTRRAAAALLREGVSENTIFVTGNTVVDALLAARATLARDPGLVASLAPLVDKFADKRILLVTCHRRQTFGIGVEKIAHALLELASRGDIGIVFPVHPNPNIRDGMDRKLSGHSSIALIEPQDYLHFVRLLELAYLILTDSGGVQEEAPVFGKPVLVMRDATERMESIDAGSARLVGTSTDAIVSTASLLLDDADAYSAMANTYSPFGDGLAAQRIAAVLS
ncbi:non-hydrolyzing UDP-N-acetylglucosamine 2-epimerase [Bauldia litoralis]|uniref:UDP-N-acetylglucosamine 2-epimerase (non-hydrolyzing) n=1 Tax=Bauldia litoralis TaxID=665467 RepID=A0A1G6CVL0_9HYPH|nr:UDP-N-acetylglucosamine 2-epimerase (non-hydrolyzing) [Bauldia litoralis]SDB36862.1 UDP-N-acetylglucosamine 2-epimerase (non-hydrolysing) [Bauldia litoralis]